MDSVLQRFCSISATAGLGQQGRLDILDPHRPISREEQLHRFGSASYALYWQAERNRKLGISWRHFCVGCAMWAYRKDASQISDTWRAFCGMNTKVQEGSRNICAEPIPLNAAYSRCYSEIIGMVVVGNPREEDTSLTLRPCEHCRQLMKSHPLITPDTIVIAALPPDGEPDSWDQIQHEIFTFEQLLKEYGEA